MYRLGCTSDKIWNLKSFIQYLSNNQGTDIKIIIDPEAICLESLGLYDLLDCFDFTSVEICTLNQFEQHDRYKISRGRIDIWFGQVPHIRADQQIWNGKKIFLCLYGRPTAGRLACASWLQERYRNQSHVHFSTGTGPDDLLHFELDKLLSYDPQLVESVGRLIKTLPLLLNSSEKRTAFNGYDYSDPLTDLYKDILIDVVVESHVMGNTFFPTEKIVRSIWMKKPFVVFSSRNFLDYLHQMGFRTFCDFWSEDYDGFEGKDRLSRIFQVIDHIASQPRDVLQTMWLDLQYTLDYNHDLLANKKYSTQLQRID